MEKLAIHRFPRFLRRIVARALLVRNVVTEHCRKLFDPTAHGVELCAVVVPAI